MRSLILIIFFNFSLFSQDSVLITKEIKVTNFKGLFLDLPAKFIFYPRQRNNSVILKIDKNFLNTVEIKVHEKNLSIKSIKNINTSLPITIIINSTDEGLEDIFLEGISELIITYIKSEHLSLRSSGITQVDFEYGKIDQLSMEIEGEYTIKFTDVDIKKALIKAEDIGEITLNVSTFLDVQLSDIAQVSYSGEAKIIQKIEDLSELKKR